MLTEQIAGVDAVGQIKCTGRVDLETYHDYLLAADLAVQLRSRSGGETSAAILDCMNAGVPVIINANGAQADLPTDAVHLLEDEFLDNDLIDALETLRQHGELRARVADRAAQLVHDRHAPAVCAEAYVRVIESHSGRNGPRSGFVQALKAIDVALPSEQDLRDTADAFASSLPRRPTQPQLFVDISELTVRDSGSGIQRVTKNVLRSLLEAPPDGFRIEPVYATTTHGYRYARSFTTAFLNLPVSIGADDPIEYRNGDIFLGLDLQPQIVSHHADFLQRLRTTGVAVWFVVYDLLPVLLPEVFFPGAHDDYTPWLRASR